MPTKPSADEIEVTLLGKGYGECVVLHPCDGEWIVIDSFLSQDQPAALQYLEQIGVAPTSVKLIIATHWHEDHIRGLAELYRASINADLALSLAFQSDEFTAFMDAHDDGDREAFRSGARELFDVIGVAEEQERAPPLLSSASTIIFERHMGAGASADVHLRALSPSPLDIISFLRALGDPASEHASRLDGRHRNGASIAAWFTVGGEAVLLGADLEVDTDPGRGWEAVVSSPRRPFGKASAVKIPHHGSITGHHDQTWADMIQAGPVSLLAPWNRGSKLPKDTDVSRIKKLSSALYTAKDRSQTKFKPSAAVVDKMIAAGGGSVTSVPRDAGRITLRKKIGSQDAWSCELADGAAHL